MRTVVLDLDVFEEDVKPQDLLAEYRRLLEMDMAALVAGGLVASSCPGCKSDQAEEAFLRFGMGYHRCRVCQSLYVSPRPTEEALIAFYRAAPSAYFWRQKLLPATIEKRVAKLFRPRAQWLLDVVDEYRPDALHAVAVG